MYALERAGKGPSQIRQNQKNIDVEIPSFIDDMCIDIVDWEGGCDMQKVEANVKRIVREVAEEYRLPLETALEVSTHKGKEGARSTERGRRGEVGHVPGGVEKGL